MAMYMDSNSNIADEILGIVSKREPSMAVASFIHTTIRFGIGPSTQ